MKNFAVTFWELLDGSVLIGEDRLLHGFKEESEKQIPGNFLNPKWNRRSSFPSNLSAFYPGRKRFLIRSALYDLNDILTKHS